MGVMREKGQRDPKKRGPAPRAKRNRADNRDEAGRHVEAVDTPQPLENQATAIRRYSVDACLMVEVIA